MSHPEVPSALFGRISARGLLPVFLLLTAVAIPTGPGRAQGPAVEAPDEAGVETEAATEEDGFYLETVDVIVVNLDVWVTDKKGQPITGLTKDDFEVYENGRQVTVTNFHAFEAQSFELDVNQRAQREKLIAEGQPIPPELQLPEMAEDERLHLVVYIDNYNIRPFNRNRVFRRLRGFLTENVRDGDRVMLVSYDRSLHIRQPFTTDPNLIAAGLFELEEVSGHAVHYDSERRGLLREIDEAENLAEVSYRVRTFAENRFNDLAFTIDSMTEIIDSLAGLTGRKALLYVSDGIPLSPGEDLYYALHQKFQDTSVLTQARDYNAYNRFNTLAAKANSNKVTFYAIDAAGLRASTASSVQSESPGLPGATHFVDSVNVSNLQQPLQLMAEATGGQVIINSNDVGPGLAKIATDFRTYYSLGYSPSHSGSGRYYDVEVRLKDKRKGAKIRHRTGYRDKPIYDRMSDGTLSSLRYGFENNPWGLVLKLGQSQHAKKNQYNVPMLLAIPLSKVVMIPRSGFHEGRLKVYFGAMDDQGDFSDVQEVDLPLRIPDDQFDPEKYYPLQDTLLMKEGGNRLAVGVWDEIGAEGSFVYEGIEVGPVGAAPTMLEN